MPANAQYGINWAIKGDEVTLFDVCTRELEKAMNGETASPTRREILEAILLDSKSGNIEYFCVSPRFAAGLCLEGVIDGLDLAKAKEVAGESITFTGETAGRPFKMVIRPSHSSIEIFYRDGSSESHFEWILNRPHSADLDRVLAEMRELLAPPGGWGANDA